jgi:hypothetical protein
MLNLKSSLLEDKNISGYYKMAKCSYKALAWNIIELLQLASVFRKCEKLINTYICKKVIKIDGKFANIYRQHTGK